MNTDEARQLADDIDQGDWDEGGPTGPVLARTVVVLREQADEIDHIKKRGQIAKPLGNDLWVWGTSDAIGTLDERLEEQADEIDRLRHAIGMASGSREIPEQEDQ